MRILSGVSAATLALALLAGCQAAPLPADSAPDGSTPPTLGEDSVSSPGPTDGDGSEATATPTAGPDVIPDGMPDDLPDIGIPFYTPSELASIMSVGGPWVIEFVTDDSVDRVRDYITDRLSAAHGWADAITEVTETFIAREGTKDGYKLTIVINNERDPNRLSLFYTLDHQ